MPVKESCSLCTPVYLPVLHVSIQFSNWQINFGKVFRDCFILTGFVTTWLLGTRAPPSIGAVEAHTAFVSSRLPNLRAHTQLQQAVVSVAIPRRGRAQEGGAGALYSTNLHYSIIRLVVEAIKKGDQLKKKGKNNFNYSST